MKATPNATAVLAAAGMISRVPEDPGAGGSLQLGQCYLANETRFIEANFSQPLTEYAVGWRDPENIDAELEFYAPGVQVPRRFEYAEAVNKEAFLSESDDVRSPGGEFKRVEYTSNKQNGRTLNKGLTMRVDMDEVDVATNWEQIYTGRLLQRIKRNDLRRAVTALATAATNTAKTWDTTSGKNPDQDVRDKVITFGDSAGLNPTRLGYNMNSWNRRALAYGAQNNAAGYAYLAQTVDEVAVNVGCRMGKVTNARFQSSGTAKSAIVPDIVLIFYAEAGQTKDDPSNIKGFWTPCEGGTRYRVYVQQITAKLVDITVEHYSNPTITSTLGIQKLTIS